MENAASGKMCRSAESPVRRFCKSIVPKLGDVVNVREISPFPSRMIVESPELAFADSDSLGAVTRAAFSAYTRKQHAELN